jgi:Protein of unknown function (DUF1566)
MNSFQHLFLISSLLGIIAPAHAVGLPDTGQAICYDDTMVDTVAASDPASIARDGGTHPRQDCRYGRDPAAAAGALVKTGAGAKGFDYSKIGNNGAVVAASAVMGAAANDWACTRDNVTGLTWEVKTGSGLRAGTHQYTWFSTNAAVNGGNAGDDTNPGGTCGNTLPFCHTEAYITAVNAGMCNATDWRLPSQRELLTLVKADGSSPSVDATYFPGTAALLYWSGTSYVPYAQAAWTVNFNETNGYALTQDKRNWWYVRLVRGGQF